jgi:histone-lysine N-methyltransferase SETMAR
MWIPDGEEVLTRPRRMIASPKRMLAVFWSPLGFSLVEIIPKGIRFDSQYFYSNILSAIVQNQPSETSEDRRRRIMVHFDNATPHTTKRTIDELMANRLTRRPHPVFSPDLAPSDFYLFGKLKMTLMDAAFTDGDELLQNVMEVLNGISREELEEVCGQWLLRSDRSIQ